MINFLKNLALFWVKNANFFANFFGENIFKIITSVPGRPDAADPCRILFALVSAMLKTCCVHLTASAATVEQTVTRSVVDIKITDRQNVDIQTAYTIMYMDITY
jgi:hypothetical protein